MKNNTFLYFKILMLTLTILTLTVVQSQTLQINQEFKRDTIFHPFGGIDKSYSFNISGKIILNSDTSLVRVILEDVYRETYLLYETYSLISPSDTVIIVNGCDETCFMEGTSPLNLRIDIIDASFKFDSLKLESDPYLNVLELQQKAKSNIETAKISNLNANIIKLNMYWRAGENSITDWPYRKKELFFGRKFNLLGFDYYKGGVFESPKKLNNTKEVSQYVSTFDWRTRHGANNSASPYFDGDNNHHNGWITTVENQSDCGTCSIFGSTGAVEGRLNLYYNIHDKDNPHHLDYDISEQDVWKCGNGLNITCTSGGTSFNAYERMASEYRCTDNFYPYNIFASNDCQKQGNPTGEIKLSGHDGYNLNPGAIDEFKLQLIKHGPFTGKILLLNHYVVVVGFETGVSGLKVYEKQNSNESDIVIEKDSRLDGQTIVSFKNSWGYNPMPGPNDTIWGVDGFGWIDYDEFNEIRYTVGALLWEDHDHDPNSSTTDIICSDEDGDGYYWWGTSQETTCASCPYGISQLEDCDDCNRDLGPYDGTYACTYNCDTEAGIFSPTGNFTVNLDTRIKKDILINSGCTITVNRILFMAPGKKITIKRGGKLLISGQGKITSSCNQLWKGIEIEGSEEDQNIINNLPNQGMIVINSGGMIENAICGIKTVPILRESGAIVNANGGIFKNNKTAVYFTKYSKPLNASYTKFENCTFQTSDVLSDGSTPVELVRLDDLSHPTCLYFKGCSFIQTGNQRIATGIKAFNSYFKCIKFNTDQTSFNGLLYGIYASRSTVSPVVTIDECSFENNAKGIYLSGLTSPQVTRNTVNIPPLNSGWIPLEGFTAYGLYLEASTAYKVEANDFLSNIYTDQIPVYIKTCGAYIKNSGPYANEIYLNTFTNLNCAVAAFGENRNGINEGLQLKCNTFENCGTDIGVYRGTLPLTTNIGIRRDQGIYNTSDPAKSAGNVFTSLSFQYHVKDIDNNAGNNLRYNHHKLSSIPNYLRMNPAPILSPNVEIHANLQSSYSTTLSCPTSLQNGLLALSILESNADSIKIMIDSACLILHENIDGGDTPGTVNMITSGSSEETASIYNDLLSKSPFLSDTSMSTASRREELLSSTMLTDILLANPQSAKSDTVYNALENRFIPLNDTLMGQIMANADVVGAKEGLEIFRAELLQQWGKNRNFIITEFLSDTNRVLSDSIIAFYNDGNSLSDKYHLAQEYAVNSNIEKAQLVLNNINTNGLNQNQQSEHLLQLEWIQLIREILEQDSVTKFDSSIVNRLFEMITSDSSFQSTASVYARNELIKAGYLNYEEPLLFNSSTKSEKVRKHFPILAKKETTLFLHVTPNPATDYIKVLYKLSPKCENGYIMISSLNGKLVKKVKVYSNQNEKVISLNNIKTNELVVSLIDCTNELISVKVITK